MAAPILWAPGIFVLFLLENPPMPLKFLLLEGGRGFFWKGGVGSANFIFMGVGILLNNHKGGTVTGGYGFGYVSDMYACLF